MCHKTTTFMLDDLIPLTDSQHDHGDPAQRRDDESLRADASKNRRVLLETAQRLFSERGVDGVTMSQIAEAAGLGKGTLYRHFPNKVELCAALLDDEQRVFQESTFAYLRQQADPADALRWFANEALTFVERNLETLAVHSQTMPLDHPAHLWWRQTMRGLLGRVRPASPTLNEYDADVLYLLLDPRAVWFQQRRGATPAQLRTGLNVLIERLLSPLGST